MPADFDNNGAAQQAGWQRTKSVFPGGYQTVYELPLSQDRQSGHAVRLTATSTVNAADADQKALAAVNGWRRSRYGADDTNASKGPRSGQDLVPDQT